MPDREPIIATLSLAPRPNPNRGQNFIASYAGISVRGHDPEHALARALIASGHDSGRPYAVKWAGSAHISLRWPSLRHAADRYVSEEDKTGLHVRRWRDPTTA